MLINVNHKCQLHLIILVITGLFLPLLPYRASAQGGGSSNAPLSNQDLNTIVALLGGQILAASAPVPVIAPPPKPTTTNDNPNAKAPSQDDLVQSLSLVNSLLTSGGLSPEIASVLQGASPTVAPPATTENPKISDAQVAQLFASLLSAAGGGAANSAASGASNAQTNSNNAAANAGLAALAGLAAAAAAPPAANPQSAQQSTQEAQAALLTNLLLQSAGAQKSQQAGAAAGGLKQQDFSGFQNLGASLDPASSNQLNQLGGVLNLLGTLGSLTNPQPQASNPLAALLGGGGGGGGGLAALLGGAQPQAQRPGFLSSIGNLASVVGGVLRGPNNGDPKLRGVDTRLGLGYRFGENADAQVVWEIGPQLFTEPLTDEQKKQLALQQQQQHVLQQRISKNPNRRQQQIVVPQQPKPVVATAGLRRHAPETQPSVPARRAPSTPQMMMLPPMTQANSPVRQEPKNSPSYLNYYAKREVDPKSNHNSQLTDYERWLMNNPQGAQNAPAVQMHRSGAQSAGVKHKSGAQATAKHRPSNQNNAPMHRQTNAVSIHRLGLPSAAPAQSTVNGRFAFTKPNNGNKIVRMRVQNRQQQQQQPQPFRYFTNPSIQIQEQQMQQHQNAKILQNRSGIQGYSTSEDSYLKRNAAVMDPKIRNLQVQREREEHLKNRLFQQRPQTTADKRAVMQTLSEWSAKNSFIDRVQNYMLETIRNEGNNIVKNVFHHNNNPQAPKVSPGPASPPQSQFQQQQQPAQQLQSQQQAPQSKANNNNNKQTPVSTTEAPGLLSSIKGMLGLSGDKTAKAKTVRPVIKVGDHVSYDELSSIMHGESTNINHPQVIPMLGDSPAIGSGSIGNSQAPFSTPNPEFFIDIANGEVSMRKPFGTMESFMPPAPEVLSEDNPKHVFNVLKEQLKKEYERVKMEQMKKAAEQMRKENIANGLSNPSDPLYMASNFFDLIEKEQIRKRAG